MMQQFLTACVIFVLIGLTSTPRAESIQAERDPIVERREAQNWLKKIQSAARQVNYAGTFVYQEVNEVRTSRITHLFDGKNELQKLEILDGKFREYIRVNNDVNCYVPDAKLILIEKNARSEVFHSVLPANFADQISNYILKNGELGRVAGYDCHSLTLEPKDNLRYGYKLCAERETGLLLRAQVINDRNEVVEQITFTELIIGNIEKSRVKSSFPNTTGWRVEHATASKEQATGWQVKWIPPGFKKMREMKRMAGDEAAEQRGLVQIVFSDGVAGISVFIENAGPTRSDGSAQQGAINVISKRRGEYLLTVVGEVPAAAVKQIVNSIEYKPK